MADSHESRRSTRYPVSAIAEVRFATDAVPVRVRDVGRRGLFAQAKQRVPVGTSIHLTLVVDEPVAHLEIDGVVVRVVETEGQSAGLGVEITDPSVVWDRFYDFLNSSTAPRAAREPERIAIG